ncbi:MAG: hypothetical protein LKI76_05385 [Megasphaera sp.]|jgi:hypothetical protein|nr:hypothetical protein [Megasphaera sp.]
MKKEHVYVNFWGDTVDCKQLYIGILAGAFFSYLAAYLGKNFFTTYFSELGKNLIAGYSLFAGLIMAVIVAAIIANIFKPKRIFRADTTTFDIDKFLRLSGLDVAEEKKYLDTVPLETIQEMKRLGLYSIFTENKNDMDTCKK